MTREHRLSRIEFQGRDALLRRIPGFDLYRWSRVTRIGVEWDIGDASEELVVHLTGEYRSEATAVSLVTFRFGGVRQLLLPELHEHGLWLSELELEDVSDRQLEGVRFELHDYGSGAFTLLSKTAAFVSAEGP